MSAHITQPTQEAVPELLPPKPEPKRTCAAMEVLGSAIYDMIILCPTNGVIRGLIMSKLGIMPPETLKTAQEIIDWIEFNYSGRGVVTGDTPPQQNRPPLRIRLHFSEIESGHCSYSRSMQGTGYWEVAVADIQEAFEGGITTMDDLRDYITDKINDDAYNVDHEMEPADEEDTSLSHFEATDSTDSEFYISQNDWHERLRVMIAQQCSREMQNAYLGPQET